MDWTRRGRTFHALIKTWVGGTLLTLGLSVSCFQESEILVARTYWKNYISDAFFVQTWDVRDPHNRPVISSAAQKQLQTLFTDGAYALLSLPTIPLLYRIHKTIEAAVVPLSKIWFAVAASYDACLATVFCAVSKLTDLGTVFWRISFCIFILSLHFLRGFFHSPPQFLLVPLKSGSLPLRC